jgi:hypothetical protein
VPGVHKAFAAERKRPRPLKSVAIACIEYCYFTGKWTVRKSCYMQTFSAKIRSDLEVLELARYVPSTRGKNGLDKGAIFV